MKTVEVDCTTGDAVERDLQPDELATIQEHRDEGVQRAAAHEARIDRAASLRTAAKATLANLEKGVAAIEGGQLFAGATAAEKAYLKTLGRAAAGLTRLELSELDEG